MSRNRIDKEKHASLLSNVYKQTLGHATGTITAYRTATACNTGTVYTKKQNQDRNDILAAKLLRKGYGITKVKCRFTENYGGKNTKEVKADVFLVVDLENKGRLRENLIELGTLFEQDSITFSEATGTSKGRASYLLIATNNCPEGYPKGGIGKAEKLGTPMFSESGELFSIVNGRPFVFEGIENDFHSFKSISIQSKQCVAILAEKEISTA